MLHPLVTGPDLQPPQHPIRLGPLFPATVFPVVIGTPLTTARRAIRSSTKGRPLRDLPPTRQRLRRARGRWSYRLSLVRHGHCSPLRSGAPDRTGVRPCPTVTPTGRCTAPMGPTSLATSAMGVLLGCGPHRRRADAPTATRRNRGSGEEGKGRGRRKGVGVRVRLTAWPTSSRSGKGRLTSSPIMADRPGRTGHRSQG